MRAENTRIRRFLTTSTAGGCTGGDRRAAHPLRTGPHRGSPNGDRDKCFIFCLGAGALRSVFLACLVGAGNEVDQLGLGVDVELLVDVAPMGDSRALGDE